MVDESDKERKFRGRVNAVAYGLMISSFVAFSQWNESRAERSEEAAQEYTGIFNEACKTLNDKVQDISRNSKNPIADVSDLLDREYQYLGEEQYVHPKFSDEGGQVSLAVSFSLGRDELISEESKEIDAPYWKPECSGSVNALYSVENVESKIEVIDEDYSFE